MVITSGAQLASQQSSEFDEMKHQQHSLSRKFAILLRDNETNKLNCKSVNNKIIYVEQNIC